VGGFGRSVKRIARHGQRRLSLRVGLTESFSMAFLPLTFDARGDNYHGIASKGSNRGDSF
jgi:hypothetical protein